MSITKRNMSRFFILNKQLIYISILIKEIKYFNLLLFFLFERRNLEFHNSENILLGIKKKCALLLRKLK